MAYVAYFICRIEYVLENWDTLNGILNNDIMGLVEGSLKFDTSAILYTNALYAILMLLPLHYKESIAWRKVAKWIFIIVNSIAIIINLADSVYFKYTGKRTAANVFQEFQNENNLSSILAAEIITHWYLFLLGIIMIAAMWRLYAMPHGKLRLMDGKQWIGYYAIHLLCFALYIPLTICGMRGGATTAVRPITISNANQYVHHPTEAAAILNTPFSILRTIGKNVFEDPKYFSETELNQIYQPIHVPGDSLTVRRKNVVVLIVESFGREYIGAYKEKLEDGKYKGYTPFVDSLVNVSLTFDYTFANGRQSISGMPSILSGIPMVKVPFFLTPYSMNNVSGLAGELGKVGYQSAFFHGAENGSMGFEAFAKTTGYQKYYGRTEFNQDKRFRGDKDFDGTWAIWDEPFMQFYALKMSEMKQPFVTSIFTASSHHPFNIPEEYKDVYKEEIPPKAKGVIRTTVNPILKCIRYTDHALQQFFATASKQPWYNNTIFVLTSDHTNMFNHEEYATDLGLYGSPILIFDPSGEMPRGRRHCIAQQTDILPSILGWLGYKNKFVAWGNDLFHTSDADTWAFNYIEGIYQYVKGDYVIQFDGQKVKAIYNYKTDWLMKHNLIDKNIPEVNVMGREIKAIIQSYMQRLIGNQMTITK